MHVQKQHQQVYLVLLYNDIHTGVGFHIVIRFVNETFKILSGKTGVILKHNQAEVLCFGIKSCSCFKSLTFMNSSSKRHTELIWYLNSRIKQWLPITSAVGLLCQRGSRTQQCVRRIFFVCGSWKCQVWGAIISKPQYKQTVLSNIILQCPSVVPTLQSPDYLYHHIDRDAHDRASRYRRPGVNFN